MIYGKKGAEKMRKPLVSVIVDNYNYERFLSQAIESVLNQTYQNFEIIVVDDGSTDNSVQIIDSYEKKDSRIRPVLKQNGGQMSAFIDLLMGVLLLF